MNQNEENLSDGEMKKQKVVMIILDGWGIGRPYEGNAISEAETPIFNSILANYPSTTIHAAGLHIGLNDGDHGGCALGHVNLGMGRVVKQGMSAVCDFMDFGEFDKNETLVDSLGHIKEHKSSIHLIGTLSKEKDKSSLYNLSSFLRFLQEVKVDDVYIHIVINKEEVVSDVWLNVIKDFQAMINKVGLGEIVTIVEDDYMMNCNNDWQKTKFAYDALFGQVMRGYSSAFEAIKNEYLFDNKKNDTCCSHIFSKGNIVKIEEGDAVFFIEPEYYKIYQIASAFTEENFDKFDRKKCDDLFVFSFGDHEQNCPVHVIDPTDDMQGGISDYLSDLGLHQARVAEVEKFGYVTFFLNGKKDKNKFEDHKLVFSEDNDFKYSCSNISKEVIKLIESEEYDFITVNLGAADIVACNFDLERVKETVETIDQCLGDIIDSVLGYNYVAVITSDHGNIEHMLDMKTDQIDNNRTNNPVPFMVVSNDYIGHNFGWGDVTDNDLSIIKPKGSLCDVAPTILKIMGIKKNNTMEGNSLF